VIRKRGLIGSTADAFDYRFAVARFVQAVERRAPAEPSPRTEAPRYEVHLESDQAKRKRRRADRVDRIESVEDWFVPAPPTRFSSYSA
jgi:hypothetical protein